MHMTSLQRELEKLPGDLHFVLADWHFHPDGRHLTVCRDGTLYFDDEPLIREHLIELDVEVFRPETDYTYWGSGPRTSIPAVEVRGRIEMRSQAPYDLGPLYRTLHFLGSPFAPLTAPSSNV